MIDQTKFPKAGKLTQRTKFWNFSPTQFYKNPKFKRGYDFGKILPKIIQMAFFIKIATIGWINLNPEINLTISFGQIKVEFVEIQDFILVIFFFIFPQKRH